MRLSRRVNNDFLSLKRVLKQSEKTLKKYVSSFNSRASLYLVGTEGGKFQIHIRVCQYGCGRNERREGGRGVSDPHVKCFPGANKTLQNPQVESLSLAHDGRLEVGHIVA